MVYADFSTYMRPAGVNSHLHGTGLSTKIEYALCAAYQCVGLTWQCGRRTAAGHHAQIHHSIQPGRTEPEPDYIRFIHFYRGNISDAARICGSWYPGPGFPASDQSSF